MEETENVSLKSIAIKYGLILGIISIVFFMIGVAIGNPQFGGFWLGLLIFIVGIVLAHREFKKNGDGFMTYGQGLGIGTLVALISSIISTIFTYIYIKFIDINFMENAREQQIEEMSKNGMSDEEIDMALKMSEGFTGPEMILVFGILGGVFMGFILSLIISAFTKNTNPELSV